MVAERYLLKTFNPKTHKDYGSPFKALDEQVLKLLTIIFVHLQFFFAKTFFLFNFLIG